MSRIGFQGWLISVLLFTVTTAQADEPQAWIGATLYPVSQPPISDAVLVIQDGKIQALGKTGQVRIPAAAKRIDASGMSIIPGLVDTHSHIGIYARPSVPANADGNEATNPITSQLRAMDAIWPADPGIRMAQAGGITTANIMPGSGNVIGGQTAYLKLRGGSLADMQINGSLGGLKMANGENPKRNYGSRDKAPSTRMAIAAMARNEYIKAQAYQEKWQRWGGSRRKPAPKRDLQLEPLVEVLQGKRIVQHHTHRADDILTVLRLAKEFNFRVVIQHGTEAYKVATELAAAQIPVSLIIIDSPGGKHEVVDYNQAGAAILAEAGVKIALHTDDYINNSRFLLREAGLAIRYGLDEATALAAITQNAADMLDLGDRIGSLEVGKDADFVILDGQPFSIYTRVQQTWVEGRKVFDRSRREDLRFATGGFAVQHRYPQTSPQSGGEQP